MVAVAGEKCHPLKGTEEAGIIHELERDCNSLCTYKVISPSPVKRKLRVKAEAMSPAF